MDRLLINEVLLENAIKSLGETFDIKAKTSRSFGFDAKDEIELEFNLNGKKIRKTFDLEIQKSASSSAINQIVLNRYESNRKQLLVARYVSPATAEKLRELDISFMDTKGNVFFKEDEFYIFISSQAKVSEVKVPKPNLIFQQSGLKLLFVLLSIPDSENYSYRNLAEISDISLGSVNEIISNLIQSFYLVKIKEKRMLVRKDELLKRWVQGYSETLRPKITNGRFKYSEVLFEENTIKDLKGCWGGEYAASLMTNYLTPAKFDLFVDYNAPRALFVLNSNFPSKKLDGEVEILRKFWTFNETEITAPPILVYADLVASADSRNLEVAKMIYDEHIARLVE
jgi:hypothetical protein